MVEQIVIFFKNLPFDEAGLTLDNALVNATKLSCNFSGAKDTLPNEKCTIPVLSFLKKTRPYLRSATTGAISKVTVPNFLLGSNPRGPRILATLPTMPIISGVATA